MPDGFTDEIWTLELALATRDPSLSKVPLPDLIADHFEEVGKSGRIWRTQDVRAGLQNPTTAYRRADFVEPAIQELAEGLWLCRYRQLSAAGDIHRTSIWQIIGGQPRIVFHQGTRAAT